MESKFLVADFLTCEMCGKDSAKPMHAERESYREQRRDDLEQDILGHLIADGSTSNISAEFLCFMEAEDSKTVQRLLNKWLDTKDGRKWFEEKLEEIINDVPERNNDDE